MEQYGLMQLKTYDVIFGNIIQNMLIWNDTNNVLNAIIFKSGDISDIKKLIKEYQNSIYNGNSNISIISIQGNNTIDLKKKQLYFISETTKKFFISNGNSFDKNDVVDQKTFLHTFHLRDVNDEWKKLQKMSEDNCIMPDTIINLIEKYYFKEGKK